jgi:hypothetical protein
MNVMDTERPLPMPGPTGDSRVDEAIAGLAVLGETPLDEHPPILEAVHDRLREILGELGGAAEPKPPPRPGQWQQGQLPSGGATPRTPRDAPDGGASIPGAGNQGR